MKEFVVMRPKTCSYLTDMTVWTRRQRLQRSLKKKKKSDLRATKSVCKIIR